MQHWDAADQEQNPRHTKKHIPVFEAKQVSACSEKVIGNSKMSDRVINDLKILKPPPLLCQHKRGSWKGIVHFKQSLVSETQTAACSLHFERVLTKAYP